MRQQITRETEVMMLIAVMDAVAAGQEAPQAERRNMS
jgi:hypothetical protein